MLPESIMIVIYEYLSQMYMLDLKKEIHCSAVVRKINRIESMGSCVIDRNLVLLMDYIYNKHTLRNMFDILTECRCCQEHQLNMPLSVDYYFYIPQDHPTKCKCPCRRYRRRIVDAYHI
jgi:hypothetical protein